MATATGEYREKKSVVVSTGSRPINPVGL